MSHSVLAGLEPRQALRAGPIASSRNSSRRRRPRAVARRRRRPAAGRAARPAPRPSPRPRQHVELPGQRTRGRSHRRSRPGRRGRAARSHTRHARRPSAAEGAPASARRARFSSTLTGTGACRPAGPARARAAPAASARRTRPVAAPRSRARRRMAPVIVVMQGMLRSIAARRISQPSRARPRPAGVLITMSTSPDSIASATFGDPSPIFFSCSTGMPMRADRRRGAGRRQHAKPEVVHARRRAAWRPACPVSHTEMKTLPSRGQLHPGAPPGPCRRRRESPRRCPSPRRWTSSPGRAARRCRAALEGQHRLLDAHVAAVALARQVLGRRASHRGSGGRPPSRAARRSPSRRTAPCAMRAGFASIT